MFGSRGRQNGNPTRFLEFLNFGFPTASFCLFETITSSAKLEMAQKQNNNKQQSRLFNSQSNEKRREIAMLNRQQLVPHLFLWVLFTHIFALRPSKIYLNNFVL